VHFIWNDKTNFGGCGAETDIFYKYRKSDGFWSTVNVVSSESTDISGNPVLDLDSNNVVHASWFDYTDYGGSGIDKDIFYKTKNSENQPPNEPEINGPTSGTTGKMYNFTFTTTDPDDDILQFYIDWGDGVTEYTEYVASETQIEKSHAWFEKGTYEIKAKAIDTENSESTWGKLSVSMPRNKLLLNTFILRFLERFPNAFPLLRKIL
jgi:hypothetical protein